MSPAVSSPPLPRDPLHDRLFGGTPAAGDDRRWASSGALALTGRPGGPWPLPPRALVPALCALERELATAPASCGGNAVTIDAPALLGERAAIAGLGRQGGRSCGGATELLPTADGWLAVSLARPSDVELLPAWLAATTLEPISTRTTRDLVASGGELGLAVAGLGEVVADRPAFTRSSIGTRPVPSSWAELVVVDLSSLWAGPLCASLLGDAGATIVKVESSRRPDGARHGPRPFYDLLHAGHRSVALDFADPDDRGRLRALVERADIVIEASRPRALAGLGLDADAAVERGAVWVSITGYGRHAFGGQRVAFGDDAAVAGGLVAGPRHEPCFLADAIADPLTGMVAAAAAIDCVASGRSALIDVAMAGVAAWCGRAPRPDATWDGAVEAPRRRADRGRASALGAETDDVMRELAGG